jgi:hypothetical protein
MVEGVSPAPRPLTQAVRHYGKGQDFTILAEVWGNFRPFDGVSGPKFAGRVNLNM